MGLSLKNGKARLPSFSIEVEDLIGSKPIDKKCYFLKVPAGRLQQTSYRHVIPRRGLYRFEGFQVSTKFPFALFRKSRTVDLPDELIVLPAVHPVSPPSALALTRGDEPRGRLGRRGEFFGLRELRDGDDRRDVHWRASARAGRLLVREREDESVREAAIHLDNTLAPDASAADDARLEKAISLAASLATTYIGRGYTVSLLARGDAVPAGSGAAHLTRILRMLALLPAAAPGAPWTGRAAPGAHNIFVGRPGASPPGMAHVMEA